MHEKNYPLMITNFRMINRPEKIVSKSLNAFQLWKNVVEPSGYWSSFKKVSIGSSKWLSHYKTPSDVKLLSFQFWDQHCTLLMHCRAFWAVHPKSVEFSPCNCSFTNFFSSFLSCSILAAKLNFGTPFGSTWILTIYCLRQIIKSI